MKRCLDIAIASFMMIFLAPVMLVLAVLVRLTSPGPALFKQKRVGRLGSLFTIYKFRSMKIERAQTGPGHTKHGDSRLTPVGGILRRYKLDELPQFFNVLIGDMSLVGPRPKLPGHETMHMPFAPGITSAATLAFRREEDMLRDVPDHEIEHFYAAKIKPVKHRLDSEYMGQATLTSDFLMLWRTVTACVSPRSSKSTHALNSTLDLVQAEHSGAVKHAPVSGMYVVAKPVANTNSTSFNHAGPVKIPVPAMQIEHSMAARHISATPTP